MSTKTLPIALRRRVVDDVEAGMSCRAAALKHGVTPKSAHRWVALWRATGSLEAAPRGGDRRSRLIEEHAGDILARFDEHPGTSLKGMAAWLKEEHGLEVSHMAVWRFLDRRGLARGRKRRGPSAGGSGSG